MFCKKCGKEIDDKAVVCVHCGVAVKEQKVKKPLYKKWWFWAAIVIVFVGIVGSAGSSGDDTKTGTEAPTSSTVSQDNTPKVPAEFAGECPIKISATVKDNIIGVPELTCNISNKTDKEIAAVQLYFLPKDVYGKDVNTIFTTEKLYTDEVIGANGSCSRSWSMLDDNIKSGDVYVYSVYFTDGTEWGDKDASNSTIKKYGLKITAEN